MSACNADPAPADPRTSAQVYINAHDARVAQFCVCFHTLRGYPEGQLLECVEGEKIAGHQRGCILGIFDRPPGDPLSYDVEPAFSCLTEAEHSYNHCLTLLPCDDTSGLNDCIKEYNEALDACPRLSDEDESKFEDCLLL